MLARTRAAIGGDVERDLNAEIIEACISGLHHSAHGGGACGQGDSGRCH